VGGLGLVSAVDRSTDPARLAGPVLALLAATAVAVGVRYALHDGESRAASLPPPAADTRPARRPPPPPAARQPPPTPPAQPTGRTYTIRSGDTLAAVAERHDISLDALVAANPDVDPRALVVGQEIRLP
jgi:Tfp pilus assembly protein FimV